MYVYICYTLNPLTKKKLFPRRTIAAVVCCVWSERTEHLAAG